MKETNLNGNYEEQLAMGIIKKVSVLIYQIRRLNIKNLQQKLISKEMNSNLIELLDDQVIWAAWENFLFNSLKLTCWKLKAKGVVKQSKKKQTASTVVNESLLNSLNSMRKTNSLSEGEEDTENNNWQDNWSFIEKSTKVS